MRKSAHIQAAAPPSRNRVHRLLVIPLCTLVLLALVFSGQKLLAADTVGNINDDPTVQEEASKFIDSLADRALTALYKENHTLKEQEDRFREILTEGFHVGYIGNISLGRHRGDASQEQLKSYFDLFPEYLAKVYTSRLVKLDTRDVRVGQVIPVGKRDMYVRTKVLDGSGKSYDVDWRVRPINEGQGYKIIDVKIEGISMARTQRDDFTGRIAKSGIDGLITFMEDVVQGKVEVPEEPENVQKGSGA